MLAMLAANPISPYLGQGENGSPNLKDVMVFTTGCESVPPLGFGDIEPSIKFIPSDGNNLLPLFQRAA